MKTTLFYRTATFVVAAGLPLSSWANEPFLFDPDGAGPDGAIVVNAFDWVPGNALAKGTLPLQLVPSFKKSTLLTHSKLGNFTNEAGNAVLGTGLNGAYEITFVGASPQLGALVSATTSIFQLTGGAPNFFEIWWDAAKNANDLAGTGYNDGVLVLSGTVTALAASFNTTSTTLVPLDLFGVNNYPAIKTGSGVGGGQITVDVTFANPNFFPDPNQQPNTLEFNTSQITPFLQTNPSAKFTGAAGGAAPTVLPVLGKVNGLATQGGKDVIFQADSNMSVTLAEIIRAACRMTGGGVTEDGQILFDENSTILAVAEDDKNRYTFGGQIGAPSVEDPDPSGEWTHHQFQGPSGDFVFRVGTASAPDDTMVTKVTCSDPGFCSPARPAPFKQLDWEGIGSFRNLNGAPAELDAAINAENDSEAGYSRHYVRVHIEDLGEPGPGGKQPHSGDCPHEIGTIVGDPSDPTKTPEELAEIELVCSSCADVYQIEIHAGPTSDTPVIYSVGGFIDAGNLQIHPPI